MAFFSLLLKEKKKRSIIEEGRVDFFFKAAHAGGLSRVYTYSHWPIWLYFVQEKNFLGISNQ